MPLIILMFVRFARSDRNEAISFDSLTDDQLEALNHEHLHGPRTTRGSSDA